MRTLGMIAALSASMTRTSDAVVRREDGAPPFVVAGRAPRPHRDVVFARASQLAAIGLAGWSAIWDRDTEVPLRLWGNGIAVPGSVADPAVAEAAARRFLADHLAVLAPGASSADFVVVANQLGGSRDIRSVGFEQRAGGIRVLGGAIGFAFKRDRLVMISSTALPHVTVAAPAHRLSGATIAAAATRWLASAGRAVAVPAAATVLPRERVILPIVRSRTDISYHLAEPITVTSTTHEPGRWDVWIDAANATPIARRNTLRFASGQVLFDVPDRSPSGPRHPQPGSFATHQIAGVGVTAALDGTVTWSGSASAAVTLNLAGPLVAISNAAGTVLAETITLASGGTFTWSRATDELGDAQLDAFVFVTHAKQFAKARLAPGLAWLDEPISVVVNETESCNAYSTGDDIHFFRKDAQCENTGRLADVVTHEFGHSLHAHSLIPGVGDPDESLGEGLADVLAALVANDHALGRGFFFDDMPFRDLDPVGTEKRWPDDATGEPHDEGEIISETLWDLKKALESKLGMAAGFDRTAAIYYTILQRGTDLPSAYAEALLADDDDGDLANGTPNLCEINAAFGTHGLADLQAAFGIGQPVRDGFTISVATTTPIGACPQPTTLTSAVVDWNVRGGSGGQITLAPSTGGVSGAIPAQPDGTVVQYKVTLTLSNGSTLTYPSNKADPLYEIYAGPVTKLWCADFEAGAGDWTQSGDWEAATPGGLAGDPKAAHGGSKAFGIDLTNQGSYMPMVSSWAESPEIELQGYARVHLQYWRWLTIEDGVWDKAKILANNTSVWSNYASPQEPMTPVNHIDKEWRFSDVDLSAQAQTGKLTLRFELASDDFNELGGWTIDDVCVVGIAAPAPACGDGAIGDGETCDDGNTADGDGCSAACQTETGSSDDGGCCSAGSGPAGPLALGALTLGLVIRRRRRAPA